MFLSEIQQKFNDLIFFMKGFPLTVFKTAHERNFCSTKSFPADTHHKLDDVLSSVSVVVLAAVHTLGLLTLLTVTLTRPSNRDLQVHVCPSGPGALPLTQLIWAPEPLYVKHRNILQNSLGESCWLEGWVLL